VKYCNITLRACLDWRLHATHLATNLAVLSLQTQN